MQHEVAVQQKMCWLFKCHQPHAYVATAVGIGAGLGAAAAWAACMLTSAMEGWEPLCTTGGGTPAAAGVEAGPAAAGGPVGAT